MRSHVLFGVSVFLLAACTAQPTDPTMAPTLALQAHLTATASLTLTPPMQAAETPRPSPTPFTYVVASGDTLSGIAEKFHIRLEVLQAANPGILPNSMPVGTVLLIPGDPGNPSGEPTPTPVSLPIQQVVCYPSAEGGMWCFVLVHNEYTSPIENISAQVTLYDPAGQVLASQVALLPLNILPPGASLPLTVFFPPSVPAEAQPRIQMLTSTSLLADDERYLPATPLNSLVQVDWSGRTAQVSGKIFLSESANGPAGQTWIAAMAYAADGRVVGVRRWESTAEVAPGMALDFAFTVFSLGPPIERVELFVEARPK